MIKVARTAWRMSQGGMSNEAIGKELSQKTGRDISAHVVAVNIGRFEARRENHPEKFFDALLDDCDIQDAEELAEILSIDIEDADEIVESKELPDEMLITLIDYYDENIVKPLADDAEPEPKQIDEADSDVVILERQKEIIDYTTDEVMKKLWSEVPKVVEVVLQSVTIPVGMLGDPTENVSLDDLQTRFKTAKHALREGAIGKAKARMGIEEQS